MCTTLSLLYRWIFFCCMIFLLIKLRPVTTRPVESQDPNNDTITLVISYDGRSVDHLQMDSTVASSGHCTNLPSTAHKTMTIQCHRMLKPIDVNLIFLHEDEILHNISIELSLLSNKARNDDGNVRLLSLILPNCTDFLAFASVQYRCNASHPTSVSLTDDCTLNCRDVTLGSTIHITFVEHSLITTTGSPFFENMSTLNFFDNNRTNGTDRDVGLEMEPSSMVWFIGAAVLGTLFIVGIFVWKAKDMKAYCTKKRKSSDVTDVELSIDSTVSRSSTPSYRYQYKMMKPRPLSFFINLRIENRRVIRNEFQELEALVPICDRSKSRTMYLPYDRDLEIFARGPWSRTAVHLTDDERLHDYINANEIRGIYYEKEYIACQEPLRETVQDFWDMILQYETKHVLMLNRFDEKSTNNDSSSPAAFEPYLPLELNETLRWGTITVTTTHIEYKMKSQLEIRQLAVEKGSRKIHLSHYLYLGWPEFRSISAPTLLELIETVHERVSTRSTPLVVHCNTGTGRTGTFIAMDILIHLMDGSEKLATSKLDIMGIVNQLRLDRARMIRREDEYFLLYRGVKEYLQKKSRSNSFVNHGYSQEALMRSSKTSTTSDHSQSEDKTVENTSSNEDRKRHSRSEARRTPELPRSLSAPEQSELTETPNNVEKENELVRSVRL